MTHPLNIDLKNFPIRENLVYINHAGTSPITKPAADMFKLFADEVSGYASAIYDNWTERTNAARTNVGRLLNCKESEVAFLKSTTQGLNLVAAGLDWKPGDVVVAEERTFPANWLAWNNVARKYGAEVKIWPERDNLRYEPEDLEAILREGNVKLVASTSANFSTGFRQDLKAVGALCRQYGALHCTDAIQTLGAFPLDVDECNIDFLAADSHKWLLGPEGAAIFYCREEHINKIDEDLIGWLGRCDFINFDDLEAKPDVTARRFEEGAPNIAGTLAMGESLKLLLDIGIDRIMEHNLSLCDQLIAGMSELGWDVVAQKDKASRASIVASRKEGVDAKEIVPQLWKEGKVWAAARRGFLRLSPHLYQTEKEMQQILETVAKVS